MLKFKLCKNFKNTPFMIPILCIISLLIIALISLIASFMLMQFENPGSYVDIAALTALIISGIICGFLSEKLNGNINEAIITLSICGAVIIVLNLIFGNILGGIMNAVCYVGPGILFSVLAKSMFTKRRHRR